MSSIKIFVSCHKQSYVPKHQLLYPIQTGTSVASQIISGMLHDDEGENISAKNARYCELTAQYWAWKNEDIDYYGFFHNRRYLSFSEKMYETDILGHITLSCPDDDALNLLEMFPSHIQEVVESCDILTTFPIDMSLWENGNSDMTVREQYSTGELHQPEDLEKAVEILLAKYPEYCEDVTNYLEGNKAWFCNLYIMKRDLFFEYCDWLYSILDEFDQMLNFENFSEYQMRTTGFIAERLYGIFMTHLLRTQPEKKVKYVQSAFFESVENPYKLPAFSEDNIPIAFTSSDDYAPIAGVFLRSLLTYVSPKKNYDLLLLDFGIRQCWLDELHALVEPYDNVSLRTISFVGRFNLHNLKYKNHLSEATYARLMLVDYMRNYDKIVYLDTDIVVVTDIAKLYSEDIDGLYFGAVRDTISAGWCNMSNHEMRTYITNSLKIKNPYDYFNGGVILFNLVELRKDFSSSQLLDLAEKREWTWMDQDVLNIVGNKKTKFLSQQWNVMAHAGINQTSPPEYAAPIWLQQQYKEACKNPLIIHWAGHALPCYDNKADLFAYFWRYARETVFYEILIGISVDKQNELDDIRKYIEQKHDESIHYTLYAVNSRRLRTRVKRRLRRLFPKNQKGERGDL